MKLNKKKWNEDRRTLETQIKEMKVSIKEGTPRLGWGQNPETRTWEKIVIPQEPGVRTSEDDRTLNKLKHHVALLYKLRAHLHGRLHQLSKVTYVPSPDGVTKVTKPNTIEYQAKEVGPLLKTYTYEVPAGMREVSPGVFAALESNSIFLLKPLDPKE